MLNEQPAVPTKPGGQGTSGWVGALLLLTAPLALFGSCMGYGWLSGNMPSSDRSANHGIYLIGVAPYLLLCVYALTRRSSFAKAAGGLGLLVTVGGLMLGSLLSGFTITRGRALRRRGKARVPCEGPDTDWCERLGPLAPSPRAASGWRINAATEAASVAAFSHLGQQLLALGAPSHLVEKAHLDALDEIRHARLCYGLARAYDGKALGPSPFPEAAWPADTVPTFSSVAAESAVEACWLESASAKVAASLATHPDVPEPVRGVLQQIASDEAAHAEHGFEVLGWCLERGGAATRSAVEHALAGFDVHTLQGVGEDDLECFGLAGPRLWHRCVAEARLEVDGWLGRPRAAA